KYILAILIIIISLFQIESSKFVAIAEESDSGNETEDVDIGSDEPDSESTNQTKIPSDTEKELKESDPTLEPSQREKEHPINVDAMKKHKDNTTIIQEKYDQEETMNVKLNMV